MQKLNLSREFACNGSIRVIDYMGSDLTVVNAARLSFNKESEEFNDKDVKLLNYLAQHKHMAPFRHVQIQFHVVCSDTVARQWYKHVVGARITELEVTEKDHAWSEVSGRYIDPTELGTYIPNVYRNQSKDNKQASEGTHPHSAYWYDRVNAQIENTIKMYKEMVRDGVAKEQARMILPFATNTSFLWTASLQAVYNFWMLRDHSHAQGEIRQYAEAIDSFMPNICPASWQVLKEHVK